jgi:biotin operon repressor
MKTVKIWTEETLAFFKEIYASTSNAELAALLGISVSSIKKKASELKLIKTAGYKLTEDVNLKSARRVDNASFGLNFISLCNL